MSAAGFVAEVTPHEEERRDGDEAQHRVGEREVVGVQQIAADCVAGASPMLLLYRLESTGVDQLGIDLDCARQADSADRILSGHEQARNRPRQIRDR